MKVSADKINAQLSKGLAPIYFISGDDPLQTGEVTDAIRAAARDQGYAERESYSADGNYDWSNILAGMDNMSLFSSCKIVEVRLTTGKPGRSGAAAIGEIVKDPPPDTLFIITAPKLDSGTAKSKWAKLLQAEAVCVTIYPLSAEQMPGWIAGRMRAAGLSFSDGAARLLAERTEGNLLAAKQEIDKLALLADGQKISEEIIAESVTDGSRYDIFQLAEAAIAGDVARASRILYGLRREGTAEPLVLWALGREASSLISVWSDMQQGLSASQAMDKSRIWRARQAAFGKALHSHTATSIHRLATKLGLIDRIVKGQLAGQSWNALLELTLAIARPGDLTLAGYEQ